MVVASIPTALVNPPAAGCLLAGGWALQVIGHRVFEKNRPAFLSDPYYLLVGPVWALAEWMRVLGLPVPDALKGVAESTVESKTANGEAASAVS
jgi:uncharacterized membrane protein YGL010W